VPIAAQNPATSLNEDAKLNKCRILYFGARVSLASGLLQAESGLIVLRWGWRNGQAQQANRSKQKAAHCCYGFLLLPTGYSGDTNFKAMLLFRSRYCVA